MGDGQVIEGTPDEQDLILQAIRSYQVCELGCKSSVVESLAASHAE